MNKQALTALAIVLGLLLILAGWYGYQQKQHREQLLNENQELSDELTGMMELKDNLEVEVDSLQEAYRELSETNEELRGDVETAKKQVAQKEYALRNARQAAASETNDLKAQIQELLAAKSMLEESISQLQMENDSLRTRTTVLERDLGQAREETAALDRLNRAMEEEVNRLTLANFKASAFQVELERKNDKVTSKARRARRIIITFDLTNVPEEYQGVRPLYLVINDEKATPIVSTEDAINTEVMINGEVVDLVAAEAKEVDIAENQRLAFTHDLSDKLEPGYYRAAVYTDIGLLGAASFRLR